MCYRLLYAFMTIVLLLMLLSFFCFDALFVTFTWPLRLLLLFIWMLFLRFRLICPSCFVFLCLLWCRCRCLPNNCWYWSGSSSRSNSRRVMDISAGSCNCEATLLLYKLPLWKTKDVPMLFGLVEVLFIETDRRCKKGAAEQRLKLVL